jgi:integrase
LPSTSFPLLLPKSIFHTHPRDHHARTKPLQTRNIELAANLQPICYQTEGSRQFEALKLRLENAGHDNGRRNRTPCSSASALSMNAFASRNAVSACTKFRQSIERMGRDDITVHGFRSTFRDWVEETTTFAGTVAEAALAHVVGDKVEAAYRRGDLFEKRRKLMTAWATLCTTPASAERTGEVIAIRRKVAEPA